MVIICVGYEKLLQDKKNDCVNMILCRKKKPPPQKSLPNGSISPGPISSGKRGVQVAPLDVGDEVSTEGSENSPARTYRY